MQDDNILYVPIQINGGVSVEGITLKDRELFIDKNGVVYVGTESGDNQVIVGRVISEAVIDSPKIINKLIVDEKIIVDDVSDVKVTPVDGQIVFIKGDQIS